MIGFNNTVQLGSDESRTGTFEPPLINVGVGEDMTIRELAETVKSVTNFSGDIVFDDSKPDGTMRKLSEVRRLNKLGWYARVGFLQGLPQAYGEFVSRAD